LKNSLEQSRYLVVICSPAAAKSHWVNEEVLYYKSHYGEDRLLCLIVGGEPNSATDSECFPPAVRYLVLPSGELTNQRTEPIAADARPHGDGVTRAKFKLLAGLLGVNFDELWQRERRRRIRKAVQLAGIISCLVVIGGIAWRWGSQEQKRRISIANYIEHGKHELAAGSRLQASIYFTKARVAGGTGKVLEDLLRDSAKALIEPLITLKGGHTQWVTFAKFIDTDHVVTAGWDKTVRLWDLNAHNSKILVTEADKVASANFSPDGGRFVTALWNGLAVVRRRDGAAIAKLDHAKERVNWADFSPDGKQVVTACDDGLVRIWTLGSDVNPTPLILSGHEGFVKMAVFDSTGTRVLTASFDCTAKIWDATTGKRLLNLTPNADGVNAARFSPDARRVATACLDGGVTIWDATKLDPASKAVKLRTIVAHPKKRTNSVAFNADGSRLITTGDDRTAKVWDTATGDLSVSFEMHGDVVVDGAFSFDGHRAVTASKDKSASVFSADPQSRTLDQIVTSAEKLAPEVIPTEAKQNVVENKVP
jgi:hypothetical protein